MCIMGWSTEKWSEVACRATAVEGLLPDGSVCFVKGGAKRGSTADAGAFIVAVVTRSVLGVEEAEELAASVRVHFGSDATSGVARRVLLSEESHSLDVMDEQSSTCVELLGSVSKLRKELSGDTDGELLQV
jgi:hypothetical protein